METLLCFEAHADDGLVWSIRQGDRWLGPFSQVSVEMPLYTVYRGQTGDEPRAYLQTASPAQVLVSGEFALIRPVSS